MQGKLAKKTAKKIFILTRGAAPRRTLSVTTFLQPGPHPVDARGVTALSVLMAQFVANDIYRPRVPPGKCFWAFH